MIKVLFFASLREKLGVDKIEFIVDTPLSVMDLRLAIIKQHPAWESELTKKNLLIAVNKEQSHIESLVHTGDEVAFFPPVTGG
jgi:molybdopterin synthase sulfur carrier subunit